MRMCGCVRERAYVCVGHVLLQNHSLMWARQRVSEKHRINRDISRQRSDWRGLIACRVFPPASPAPLHLAPRYKRRRRRRSPISIPICSVSSWFCCRSHALCSPFSVLRRFRQPDVRAVRGELRLVSGSRRLLHQLRPSLSHARAQVLLRLSVAHLRNGGLQVSMTDRAHTLGRKTRTVWGGGGR